LARNSFQRSNTTGSQSSAKITAPPPRNAAPRRHPRRKASRSRSGTMMIGTILMLSAIPRQAPASRYDRFVTSSQKLSTQNITKTGSVLPWYPEITIRMGLTAAVMPATSARRGRWARTNS
jgi:hypothetical protein